MIDNLILKEFDEIHYTLLCNICKFERRMFVISSEMHMIMGSLSICLPFNLIAIYEKQHIFFYFKRTVTQRFIPLTSIHTHANVGDGKANSCKGVSHIAVFKGSSLVKFDLQICINISISINLYQCDQ